MAQVLKKRTIFILGGSGFIGNAVISELLSRGHRIFATYCNHPPLCKEKHQLTWIEWDANREALPRIEWREVDTVLHLANYHDLRSFPEKAKPIYRVIVESTFNLLETAYQNKIERIVVASTGAVLSSKNVYNKEDENYAPENFYAVTKACAELLTNAFSKVISTAIVRFYYPYGPGGERYLIGRLTENVKEGREILIEGENGVIINPVYLSDLATGIALALESDETGIFHLPGPDRVSLRSFLELAGKLVGCQPNIKSISKHVPGGHAGFYTRSHELLGYSPVISLEEGLKNILGLK